MAALDRWYSAIKEATFDQSVGDTNWYLTICGFHTRGLTFHHDAHVADWKKHSAFKAIDEAFAV